MQVTKGKKEVVRNPSHSAQNLRASYYGLSTSMPGTDTKVQKGVFYSLGDLEGLGF